MNKSYLFNDNEPGIYRQRAVLEFRILEEKVEGIYLKKYLKNLAEKLGMKAHPDQPEPLLAATQNLKYEHMQVMFFCVEGGLHLVYWEKPQFITLDIHVGMVLDQQLVEQLTKTMFEVLEYYSLELLPQNNKKDSSKIFMKSDSDLGRGLFAREDIAKGEFIAGLYGQVHAAKKATDLPEEVVNHVLHFAENKWRGALPDSLVAYNNHSCQPNMSIKGLFDFVAIKDIKAGEELCSHYGLYEDSNWEVPGGKCLCGASGCLGTIPPYQKLPDEVKERYRDYTSAWLKKKYKNQSNDL